MWILTHCYIRISLLISLKNGSLTNCSCQKYVRNYQCLASTSLSTSDNEICDVECQRDALTNQQLLPHKKQEMVSKCHNVKASNPCFIFQEWGKLS